MGKQVKTVLIYGVSSFVGSNLAEFLKQDYKVFGTYNDTPIHIPGVLSYRCDVLSKEEVQLIAYATKPDFVIYTCGLSSILDCSKSDELADALNTAGLFNVSDAAQRYQARLLYISSSFVFNGTDKAFGEMDIPDANTMYGKTKASAEFFIQKTSLNYLIIRTCQLYGRSINPRSNTFFEIMEKKMVESKTFIVDSNVKVGFLDIMYLAMVIRFCFEKDVSNRLFQLSSKDCLTYYDFTQAYSKVFGQPSGIASKGAWELPLIDESITNNLIYNLDISNIENFLNHELPTIEESLQYTFQRLNGEEKNSRSSKSAGITFI